MNNSFDTITNFDMIQTFYADPEAVNNSGEVSLTSIDLFFKNKPKTTKNISGIPDPGVVVRICEVTNNEPDLTKVYHGYVSYRTYDEIYAFSDASSPTAFGFSAPLKLQTGKFYGIVIALEDASYELWTNKTGDKLVGTSNISSGISSLKDGKLYLRNNAGIFNPLSDTDLKFGVNCAQYTSNTLNEVFVNDSFEFLTLKNIDGRFIGGEWVYQTTANSTGNVAFTANSKVIRGDGTDFANEVVVGDKLVLFSNSSYEQFVDVLNVVNSTYIETATTIAHSNTETKFMVPPLGQVHYFGKVLNELILVNSNANTTLKFATNGGLRGEDSRAIANVASVDVFTVDRVRFKADFFTPPSGTVNNAFTFTYFDGSNYVYDAAYKQEVKLNQERMHDITQYNAYIMSRSLEVDNVNLASNTELLFNNKSVTVNTDITVQLSNTELYQTPTIDSDKLDMFVVQNIVSDVYLTTDANNTVIDSEVGNNGIALSKHISKKVTFANNRFAEDIRVYMNAYRPAGTDLKVYARIHNSADSDAFDDMAWTPLEYKENINKYSSRDDENDIVEYTLGLPLYPDSANALPGTFTTELANNVIVASGVNPSSYTATNDVVKVYNPLIPEDYIVATVASSNSTAIVLGDAISNNNLVGYGFNVDRLKYYNTAFNNITNDNVSRYYSSSLVEFDKFDSMQYKIVMLANTTFKAPRVDSVTFIGVSA